MYKTLRIICCVISALALAACVFIFIYLGFVWGLVTLFVAAAFFGLMLLFKNLQEQQEQKLNPSARKGDFITGPVSTEETVVETTATTSKTTTVPQTAKTTKTTTATSDNQSPKSNK